jgi:signal peptidase I
MSQAGKTAEGDPGDNMEYEEEVVYEYEEEDETSDDDYYEEEVVYEYEKEEENSRDG